MEANHRKYGDGTQTIDVWAICGVIIMFAGRH